jgi:hypothetical protein
MKQAYRCPYMLREEMKRQVDEMKDKRAISEAASEWSAPVILVSKKIH